MLRRTSLLPLLLGLTGCPSSSPPAETPPEETQPTSTEPTSTVAPADAPTASASAVPGSSASASASAAPASSARDVVVPPGSADYSAALADAKAYKKGEISFEELKKRVLARKLPPHRLGDAYLFMTPPPPPPGIVFNPLLMPSDWKGTWGEITMTLFADQITREEYDKLHKAAHPACK